MVRDCGGTGRPAASRGAGVWRRTAIAFAASLLAAAAVAAAAQAQTVQVPFQRGITVGEWGRTAYAPGPFARTTRRLKRTTANDSVTLFAVWTMPSATSTQIGPTGAVSQRNLAAAVRAARKRGLSVILRPYFDVADGSWRGEIQPTDVNAWFASYRKFILHFATFAQKHRVDGLVVESELGTMERYTSRWNAVIRAVRKRFTGFLTASSNWDVFQRAQFWGRLDAIGISAYFPVLGPMGNCPTSYTAADLVGGWQEWYQEIKQVHDRFARPVLFTELGYTKDVGSPCRPWDTQLPGPTSAADQAKAYQAALKVWYRVPWFRGMAWWYVPDQPSYVKNTPSGKHVPAKPARVVIKRWYRRPR